MKRPNDKTQIETWSQTKKEKLEESEIPQLNEDVLGIILRHVIRKHQNHVQKM